MIAKKVLLVGNFGVGKTSLIRRFVVNEFSEDYISTIGVRVSTKIIENKGTKLKLLIWDIAGTHKNEYAPKAYFLGASAAMFVFDLSREETYLNINDYLNGLKSLSGLDNIIIVGNKSDLVDEDKIKNIIAKVDVKVDYITSAKSGNNVEDAFQLLGKMTLK